MMLMESVQLTILNGFDFSGMKTLIIDNYDSFTYNLFQMIAEINEEKPRVVYNDCSWDVLSALEFANIVISPGPGSPENDRDFGINKKVLLETNVPVLGVCLGHIGLGHVFGGKIRPANCVMHGRLSQIKHISSPLFHHVPQDFSAVRYHSLVLDENLPECFVKTAWTEDGQIMGIMHKIKPFYGIQFHPESVLSEFGTRILRNFREITEKFYMESP